MKRNSSYSSPKVEMRESSISGRGLFAKENIKKDELIVSFVGGKCNCGSKNCQKIITGNDWKIPELQERHKGYFSDYLAKKML